jgi:hypothetical protein
VHRLPREVLRKRDLHKVPTPSSKVSPRTLQTAFVISENVLNTKNIQLKEFYILSRVLLLYRESLERFC